MLFYYSPESACVWCTNWFTFEKYSGSSCEQRSVKDIGMAYDPTNVRGTKYDVSWAMDAEEIPYRKVEAYSMSASFSEYSLWRTGST